jgi:DNA-binding CsgD family transcriptional regulator
MLFSKISQQPQEKKINAEEILTRRELDVMDYLLKGLSYKEIAENFI